MFWRLGSRPIKIDLIALRGFLVAKRIHWGEKIISKWTNKSVKNHYGNSNSFVWYTLYLTKVIWCPIQWNTIGWQWVANISKRNSHNLPTNGWEICLSNHSNHKNTEKKTCRILFRENHFLTGSVASFDRRRFAWKSNAIGQTDYVENSQNTLQTIIWGFPTDKVKKLASC